MVNNTVLKATNILILSLYRSLIPLIYVFNTLYDFRRFYV